MHIYLKTILLVLVFVLSACATQPPPKEDLARPAWIDNPGDGVSASAGMHIRGRVAQEELAISRARTEFAKRFGVNVQSVGTITTTVANGRANTVGSEIAHEDSQHVEVRAMVKAKWRETGSDVLWVWLVPGN
jgi:hypothetical protein